MGNPSNPWDLDRLLARFVDGEPTGDDIAALEKLLDGNADAQRRYVHYVDLHTELLSRSDVARSIPSSVGTNDSGRAAISDRTTTKLVMVAALAAVVLIAIGSGIGHWMAQSSDDDSYARQSVDESFSGPVIEDTDNGVAVLTHAVDVEWSAENSPHAGSILSPGALKLSGGLIEIEFYNGVRLIVEGPADVEIVSVTRVICREGRLRSLVPLNATGFSVLTPRFEVVDLGTEFAVDVASDGRSDVHVFDGEVELYSPDGKREGDEKHALLVGHAIEYPPAGMRTPIAPRPETFASFEDVRAREQSAARKRFESWRRWNEDLRDDPRIVCRYDFESDDSRLVDSGATGTHGTIVGCEWASGRWPEKRALGFKRPGDRVRIDVPGEFDALTVSAWVRVDALPSRRQALLLTDGYEVGRLHWQIGTGGELRVGSRIPPQKRRNTGYASPPVFTNRQIGVWNCVCSTYDRTTRTVTHWFNGRRVFTRRLEVDQPIRIGMAEIGNWGVPYQPERHAIRNFIGRMDELTIWNVALDEHEIAGLYHASRP